jgi:hypothetical protein
VEEGHHSASTTSTPTVQKTTILGSTVEDCGGSVEVNRHTFKPLPDNALGFSVEGVEVFSHSRENSESQMLSCTTEPIKFVEQIKKAIANFDRPLALEITKALEGKAKAKLRNEVKDALAPNEAKNFKLLAKAGFLWGMRVRYVGDSKYAEQYEGLELEVHSMDAYFQISCRKPDGSFTTWLKPEELEAIS